MKKIDIEKWERKTPELPENFFEEMQKKVLDKTVRVEKRPVKRFKINPAWASAAAIAVVFGISFFVNFKNKNVEVAQNPQVVQSENISTLYQADIVNQEATENQPYTEPKTSFAGQSSDAVSEQKIKNLSTKLKMEEVLNVMSEEELQELTSNYEQDTFLDLY